MRHWSRWSNLFDLQRNRVRLVRADPDGQHSITLHIFQDDYWSPTVRIHHQRANFYLDFHFLPLNAVRVSRPVEAVCLRLCDGYVDYFTL